MPGYVEGQGLRDKPAVFNLADKLTKDVLLRNVMKDMIISSN